MSARLTTTLLAASGVFISLAASSQEPKRQPAGPTLFDTQPRIEIKKPDNFTDQELKVIRGADVMSMDRLAQLLQVYERLGNDALLDVVVKAILRRDPDNAEAKRVRDSGALSDTTRPAGYLDEIQRKVMAGQKVEDADSVPVQAAALILTGRAPDAVALLEKLRANQFGGGAVFPYLDDLAYALSEAGRLDEAESAYRAVIADGRQPQESQQEARAALPGVQLKKEMLAIRKRNATNADGLAKESAALLAKHPEDEDVISFRIDSLMNTQRYDEALSYLQSLRAKHNPATGPWPLLPTLGYCYAGMRQTDKAVAIFREIQKDPAFDDAAHLEAESMILEVQVGAKVEAGMAAINHGDMKKAGEVLKVLERDYRTHREVVGYKAIYMVKNGHGDIALETLETLRQKEAAQGMAFTQQDALADVYLELKEYNEARAANFVIINDPRYSPEEKAEALKRMEDIYIAEQTDRVDKALRDGRRAQARAIVAEMYQKAPNRIEVRMANAEVALAYFDSKYALSELKAAKASPEFASVPFPAQNSLAAAMAQEGDWAGAWKAYGEVLDQPATDDAAEDRFDAVWERRNLATWFMPHIDATTRGASEEEGSMLQTELAYTSEWINGWRFRVFARDTATRLKGDGIFGHRKDDHGEAGLVAQKLLGNGYYVEAMAGGSEDDVIYSAHIGRMVYGGLSWSVGFVGNALSTDSVNLQALNGRENRAEFHVAGPVSDRINFELEGYYQWVKLGGSRLGEGYGAAGSIDYILQTETRKRPEISIGYFFEYSRFDRAGSLPPRLRSEVRRATVPAEETRKALASNSEVRRALSSDFGNEVFDSLVDNYTNRHGIMLKARKHFQNGLALSGQLGAFYAFDDRAAEWTAAAALEYWINDHTMIYAELRYESAGKGASSNAGIWEASVGGQMTF